MTGNQGTTLGGAVGGFLLIAMGSLIATLAPGDGQTGMVVYPGWIAGAILGAMSLDSAFRSPDNRGLRGVVVALALLAVATVGGAFVAVLRYEAPRHQPTPPTTSSVR